MYGSPNPPILATFGVSEGHIGIFDYWVVPWQSCTLKNVFLSPGISIARPSSNSVSNYVELFPPVTNLSVRFCVEFYKSLHVFEIRSENFGN